MKFLLSVVFFAFLALAAADPLAVPNTARNTLICPSYCTELYNPRCAMNLRCTALFGNPCKLDAWNCKTVRSEEIFYQVDMSYCRHLDGYNNIQCRPN